MAHHIRTALTVGRVRPSRVSSRPIQAVNRARLDAQPATYLDGLREAVRARLAAAGVDLKGKAVHRG